MPEKRVAVANDTLDDAACILQAEVDRAICTLRRALGDMGRDRRLHPSLMGVVGLMDRVEFHVTYDSGESAFELDEIAGAVRFRSSGLERVLEGAQSIADEVGIIDAEEVAYQKQLAINLFVAHELLHICQNFPHFPTVDAIKRGMPGIGLPLLDAVADIVSASICAHAELASGEEGDEDEFLKKFSNTLIVSYAIGSFIFDASTKPEKRQRALGLVVAAMMIQALAEGRLIRENVNAAWKPTSPLLLLNVAESGAFNAFIVDEIAGILFINHTKASPELAMELWRSVGRSPIARTLELVSGLLKQIDVVK